MNLFLVRHGETDKNANCIVQGWLDTDLNEHGIMQARNVSKNFNESIDAIYSSDLQRAVKTAEEFRKKYPQVLYFKDKRLRERDFGDATGDHRDKHDWEVFWASSDTVSIPNAETLQKYNQRVQAFIDDLKVTGFSNVLIVTHGGTINRFRDLTSDDHHHVTYGNASGTRMII